jgi:hypothetical protein
MSDEWDGWYDIQQHRCLERDTALQGINPTKVGTFWAVKNPQTSSASLNRTLQPGPLQRMSNARPKQRDPCG